MKRRIAICSLLLIFTSVAYSQTYQSAFENARALLKQKRYTEALQEAERANSIDNSQWGAYFVAGTALVGLDRQANAILKFQGALQRAPEQAKPTINEAIAACRQILANRSPSAPAPSQPPQYAPANAALITGGSDSSNICEKKSPQELLAISKNADQAANAFQLAASQHPSVAARCYFYLGAVMTIAGRNEEAAAAYKRAIDIDPNLAEPHYQYGIYLTGRAKPLSNGKLLCPKGTSVEFRKYLELSPTGDFADSAKAMLSLIVE